MAKTLMWDLLVRLAYPVTKKANVNEGELTLVNGVKIRIRGCDNPDAFALYEVMSLVGFCVHVAVFTSLQNIGFLLNLLGTSASRVVQNLIGASIALILNWFLNTTYLWRRKQR